MQLKRIIFSLMHISFQFGSMYLPCPSTSLLPGLELSCITVMDNRAVLHAGGLTEFSGSIEFFIIKVVGNNAPKVIYNPAVKAFKISHSSQLV